MDKMAELMDVAVSAALEINDYAAKRGVRTLCEDQGYIVNGVKNYGEFMKRTDGKIGVLLDFGNITFYDESAVDFYAAFPDIKQIHVKDMKATNEPLDWSSYKTVGGRYVTGCAFGEGDVDMERLAVMLKERGYGGYYSLEFNTLENDAEVDALLDKMAKTFG